MSIITYPLNAVTYDASEVEMYLSTRTSGVYYNDPSFFKATVVGTRQISVAPGLAWINNGTFKGKMIASTETVNIDIPIANSSRARKDLIVLRFDATLNKSYFDVKQGTASTSPVAPTPTKTGTVYELGLYVVNVPAASSTLSAANIENVIPDSTYCGIMRDNVAYNLDLQYPVGAVYISNKNVSPASLFGGTWNPIRDVFLLGAGNLYSGGVTGGSATVALNASQIPPHSHAISIVGGSSGSLTGLDQSKVGAPLKNAVSYYAATTASAGSGEAHPNMPPYKAYYMWERIE
jgi:hypothetical protein